MKIRNPRAFRIAKYKDTQIVKLKLPASDIQTISTLLFKNGAFDIMDKITDQMIGKHSVEWQVIKGDKCGI